MFGIVAQMPLHSPQQFRETMGEIMEHISAKELAKKEGIGMDALRARWNTLCAERPELFRERWDKNRPINFAQETALRSAKSAAKKGRTKRENPGVTSEPARANESAPIALPQAKYNRRTIGLVAIAIPPTAASVENMFFVTSEILGDVFAGIMLTALLSCTALAFVLLGVRHKATYIIAVALVLFEVLCNLIRIYAGLFETSGNPKRFLSLFCEIFGTGNHGAAIGIGAFTGLIIAAVQFSAVWEIGKNK